MAIEVKQTIEIYEEDDAELPIGSNKSIGIESHWNSRQRVVLVWDKKRITVIGQDVITAIENAMNTNWP